MEFALREMKIARVRTSSDVVPRLEGFTSFASCIYVCLEAVCA